MRFALKGREIAVRLTCANNAFDLEPFQGLFAEETRFPGLKPGLKCSCPFGAWSLDISRMDMLE